MVNLTQFFSLREARPISRWRTGVQRSRAGGHKPTPIGTLLQERWSYDFRFHPRVVTKFTKGHPAASH
jgi:hypothetical protein